MKIYHKKGFISGLFWIILGIWLLILRVVDPERFLPEQIKDIVFALLLILIGVASVLRACSEKAARADKLEELDERNRLIARKAKSKAFQLTQGICLGLMLAFFLMGKASGEAQFTGMGVGLAFAYAISMFAEIITYCHYEKHG